MSEIYLGNIEFHIEPPFPENPIDGQIFNGFAYEAANRCWAMIGRDLSATKQLESKLARKDAGLKLATRALENIETITEDDVVARLARNALTAIKELE